MRGSFLHSPLTMLGWSLVIVYLTFHLATLTKIQDVYGDEAAGMQTALTLLKTGEVGTYAGRDVYSPSFQFLTNALPYGIRPFASDVFGFYIRLYGPGLTTARLASWSMGALGVILLYTLALRLFGPLGGLGSLIILLSDPILGTCLHICREEPLLFAAQALVGLLWAWAFTRNSFWLALLAGCAAGLAPGLHPNGLVLVPALGAMALVMHQSSKEWIRAAAGLALGLLCGLILWAMACSWDEFILGWKIWGGYWGYGLPILSGQSLLSILGSEAARYLHPQMIPQSVSTGYYVWALRLEYSVVALALALALWRSKRERREAVLATGLLTAIFGMSLIVARKYAGYSLLTLPWMALLVGSAVSCLEDNVCSTVSKIKSWLWGGILGLTGVGLLVLGTKAVTAQASDPLPYLRTCRELSRWIPIGSRVLGPGQFWLEMPGRDWRDANYLLFEKWLTNGSRHVGPALDRIRPDFVVVDEPLNRLLAHAVKQGSAYEFSLVARVQDQEPGKELLLLRVRPKRSSLPPIF